MVVEVTTFRVKDDVDDERFVAADARWQEALMLGVPGFVRRTMARSTDDPREWVAVALWGTVDDATAAQELVDTADAGRSFHEHVEQGSIAVRRYRALDQ